MISEYLSMQESPQRTELGDRIVALGDAAVPELLNAVRTNDWGFGWILPSQLLRRIDSDAVRAGLTDMAHSQTAYERLNAVYCLRAFEEKWAADLLTELRSDPDKDVSDAARRSPK